MKTIKCWGIPHGLKNQNKTEEVTIEMKCSSIKEFKQYMKDHGHKLTGEPYVAKD